MATVLFRCAVIACFSSNASCQIESLVERLNRLSRIVKFIRQYYGLHPNFAKDRYGSIDVYLRQHLSEQDWVLLAQLQVIKPIHIQNQHKQVLDIA